MWRVPCCPGRLSGGVLVGFAGWRTCYKKTAAAVEGLLTRATDRADRLDAGEGEGGRECSVVVMMSLAAGWRRQVTRPCAESGSLLSLSLPSTLHSISSSHHSLLVTVTTCHYCIPLAHCPAACPALFLSIPSHSLSPSPFTPPSAAVLLPLTPSLPLSPSPPPLLLPPHSSCLVCLLLIHSFLLSP